LIVPPEMTPVQLTVPPDAEGTPKATAQIVAATPPSSQNRFMSRLPSPLIAAKGA
jgi:hypothetical protein